MGDNGDGKATGFDIETMELDVGYELKNKLRDFVEVVKCGGN
jgi:hypothetical protein